MGRPTHFEIHADDPERASRFYGAVFGWTVTKWDGPMDYWLVSTGEDGSGINGAIVTRRGPRPQEGAPVNGYVCTTVVDAIDEASAAIERNGGKVAVPKAEIPGIGLLFYANDTEGNLFGVLQPFGC